MHSEVFVIGSNFQFHWIVLFVVKGCYTISKIYSIMNAEDTSQKFSEANTFSILWKFWGNISCILINDRKSWKKFTPFGHKSGSCNLYWKSTFVDEQLYHSIRESDGLKEQVNALMNTKESTEETKNVLLDELKVSHDRMKDLQGVVGL